MTTQEYLDSLAALSLPTETQLAAFADHLPWAHSWYKHLPITGSRFVVFLASDAGSGFETEPRLHYGWKTSAEYRERFGALDYAYWVGTDVFRDCGDIHIVDALPGEVREALSFTLFPFVSTDFNAPESIGWGLHDEVLAELRGGASHPHASGVLAWADADEANDATSRALSESESRLAAEIENGDALSPTPMTPNLEAHLEAAAELESIYLELQKTQQAIISDRLRALVELYRPLVG